MPHSILSVDELPKKNNLRKRKREKNINKVEKEHGNV